MKEQCYLPIRKRKIFPFLFTFPFSSYYFFSPFSCSFTPYYLELGIWLSFFDSYSVLWGHPCGAVFFCWLLIYINHSSYLKLKTTPWEIFKDEESDAKATYLVNMCFQDIGKSWTQIYSIPVLPILLQFPDFRNLSKTVIVVHTVMISTESQRWICNLMGEIDTFLSEWSYSKRIEISSPRAVGQMHTQTKLLTNDINIGIYWIGVARYCQWWQHMCLSKILHKSSFTGNNCLKSNGLIMLSHFQLVHLVIKSIGRTDAIKMWWN